VQGSQTVSPLQILELICCLNFSFPHACYTVSLKRTYLDESLLRSTRDCYYNYILPSAGGWSYEMLYIRAHTKEVRLYVLNVEYLDNRK